jgi:predicted unusual protein kinase regulating ubiquinone biosynthesis (AarF/ABC1/UbiB family)
MPSGKLGLIDYGQIKLLKPAQRRSLARMIVALADGKREEVIDLFVQMGFKSKVRVFTESGCVCNAVVWCREPPPHVCFTQIK